MEEPPQRHARWLRTDRILLLIGAAVVVWALSSVLLIVFAGILFGLALDAFARLVARVTRLPRIWGFVLVMAVLVALTALAVDSFVLPLIGELGQIVRQLPDLADDALDALSQQVGIEISSSKAETENGLARRLADTLAPASAAIVAITISLVVVAAIGIFVAINPSMYTRGILRLVPRARRARIDEVLGAVGSTLRWWLIGQACSMAILGTVTATLLYSLDVPLALGLGMLTAFLTFVPYFGPMIAGVPVLLLSFSQGTQTGVIVTVVYVILQNVEGYFLTPAIQQRASRLPPAVLIAAQVAMSVLFGIPGLLLAAPVTAVAMIAIKELYIRDYLGDREDITLSSNDLTVDEDASLDTVGRCAVPSPATR